MMQNSPPVDSGRSESSGHSEKSSNTEIPFWWHAAPREADTGDGPPDDCDVAIVGAGYTGLTAALYLANAGYKVVVLDREAPGHGASSRNGGIASGNLRLGVEQAQQQYGEATARKIFQEGVEARTHLGQLIRDYNIDCDYHLNGRFTGALTEKDLQKMSYDIDRFSQFTGIEAYAVNSSEVSQYIGSELYVGGVVRTDIAHFHPGKMHLGLLAASRKAGAIVCGFCNVEAINSLSTDTKTATSNNHTRRFSIRTNRGSVSACDVIMATNGYNDSTLDNWLTKRIVPVTSRIVVTESLSENLVATLAPGLRAMGENRNLFRYFRPGPDGDRMIFGSREPIMGSGVDQAVEHVRRGMVEVFPELAQAKVESSWSGYVAFSRAQLPLLFEQKGIHYATGYCGSGTVWAPWFGKLVAEKIIVRNKGEPQPESQSQFYCEPPAAIPLYNGKPWFLPAAMMWEGFQDKLKGRN